MQGLGKYKLCPTLCPKKCGVMAVKLRRGATTCRAHSKREKHMADVVSMLLESTQGSAADYTLMQQVPIARRAASGRFCKRRDMRIDLVMLHNHSMLGIEVHGSAEHLYNDSTVKLDKLKAASWQKQGARAWGQLRVVWGNGVGAPKQKHADWYASNLAALQPVVQSFIATT